MKRLNRITMSLLVAMLAGVVATSSFERVELDVAPLAFADNADESSEQKEVVETEISVDPVSAEATKPDAAAQDKKDADEIDVSSNQSSSSKSAPSPSDQTDVETDYGLPADSPLFSGVEEDVDVKTSKDDDATKEETPNEKVEKSASPEDAASNDAGEVSPEAVEEEATSATLIPDDDWLARGNAVLPLQLPDSSFIYDTSIQELSNADPYLNNQTVQVTGEAIGESIRASLFGRSRWVTLSPVGESATISVFMSEESAAKIDSFGRYGVRGSILKVRGTFYLVCPEHDGFTDLHAEEVTVVKPGESVHESFKIRAFVPGIILVIVGVIMTFIFSRISERRR